MFYLYAVERDGDERYVERSLFALEHDDDSAAVRNEIGRDLNFVVFRLDYFVYVLVAEFVMRGNDKILAPYCGEIIIVIHFSVRKRGVYRLQYLLRRLDLARNDSVVIGFPCGIRYRHYRRYRYYHR